MGTVYLARHEQTGQEVAVKVLAPSLAREAGLVARFMREIDALQKLKNPHVVQFYEHGVDNEMYYYAMEYVEGETLTARLRREKRLPWREVVELSIQICVAFKAAHDAGIIHRDLKPSNLLLSPDGTVKLTDFGVAHVFAGSKLTITGGIIGTAEYMSPEQGQGQRITKRSDLYSLGAVMYVMLTGRPPFSGKTTLDVVHKHKYSQFDRPRMIVSDLPHWIDDIVCQLMEKDPDKRFADAYVVNRRLQEAVRKIELSTSDQTVAEEEGSSDGTTIEVGSARGSAGQRLSSGPGPGTLMRDLFRAEIEGQQLRGEWRRIFDNTLFLVGLLIVLAVSVAYWVTRAKTTSEDADASVQPRPASEIERLQNFARRQQREGDLAGAERTLAGLSALLVNDPQYETQRKSVERSLRILREHRSGDSVDQKFVAAALERADKLATQGQQAAAEQIWHGIVDLYGNEPSVSAEVAQAQKNFPSHRPEHPGKTLPMNEPLDLKRYIRSIPDFPRPGVMFRDITPLLAAPKALRQVIETLAEHYRSQKIDSIVAAEARGFIFAAPLALCA